jgi:hypothetical protein
MGRNRGTTLEREPARTADDIFVTPPSSKTPEEHMAEARKYVDQAIKAFQAAEHTATELRHQLEKTRVPSGPSFEIDPEQSLADAYMNGEGDGAYEPRV